MGDIINELPIDDLPPTNDEKDMIKWMFPAKKEDITEEIQQPKITNKFYLEIKALLIIIFLYIIISNNWTDWMIQKILPLKNNILILGVKSILFAIILMIFFNLFYKKT